MNTRNLLLTIVAATSMQLGAAASSSKAVPGIHFLGLPRANHTDVDALATALAGATGDVGVASLYDFNPEDPFSNLGRLVRRVLPSLKKGEHLDVSIYLMFDHEHVNRMEQDPFWIAWESATPNESQKRICADYIARVQKSTEWIRDTRAWADERQLARRLRITVVPVLEDTCPSSRKAAYSKLIEAIRCNQTAAGVASTLVRRSCLAENMFRLAGVSIELHGLWSKVRARGALRRGDVWSPDGYEYADASKYEQDARDAANGGISSLYWTASFNGAPRSKPPSQRIVNPLSGSDAASELSKIRRALRAR